MSQSQLKGRNWLGEVESFIYLGSLMDKSGGIDTDVKTRINKAQLASNTLKWFDDRGKSAHPPRYIL